MYKVFYTKKAKEDLQNLEFVTAKRIVRKIYIFSVQKNPLQFAKKLKNTALGMYRFRIGDYRAVFDIDKRGNIKILVILRIKHRKDIYR